MFKLNGANWSGSKTLALGGRGALVRGALVDEYRYWTWNMSDSTSWWSCQCLTHLASHWGSYL